MNTNTRDSNPFRNLVDAYVKELIATPDEEILEGCDPEQIQREALARLDAAKAEAGRRRLEAARQRASTRTHAPADSALVSTEDARRYLQKASNDARYTLAARNLGELSDEEVLRIYSQVKALELRENSDDGVEG